MMLQPLVHAGAEEEASDGRDAEHDLQMSDEEV